MTYPTSSAPLHSTAPPVGAVAATPSVVSASPSTGDGAATPSTPAEFWKWGLAFVLFWFIVVALHEYGGNAQTIGSGFALLVLTTVLLTQGGKAMSNAVALFQPA